MVDKIIEILRLCHERWPTSGTRHCFTWDIEKDKLLLTIFVNEVWYTFNPENDELDDPNQAVEDMAKWLT